MYLLLAAGFNITVTLLGFLSIGNGISPYAMAVLQHFDINMCSLNKKNTMYKTSS